MEYRRGWARPLTRLFSRDPGVLGATQVFRRLVSRGVCDGDCTCNNDIVFKTTMLILIMILPSRALFSISGHLTPDTSALFFPFAPLPCPFSYALQLLRLICLVTVLARATRARACANRNWFLLSHFHSFYHLLGSLLWWWEFIFHHQ